MLYLQWTKRTGKTKKHPASQVHFLLQKNTGNNERQIMTSKEVMTLALFSCHQPRRRMTIQSSIDGNKEIPQGLCGSQKKQRKKNQ